MSNQRSSWSLRGAVGGFSVAAVAAVLLLPTASFVYEMGGGESCARCHEIAPNHQSWMLSAHKNVACTQCHGDALTLDPDFHLGNLRRIAVHFFGELPERIHLRSRDIEAVSARCGTCHQQEQLHWKAGGHSASYAAIFLRPGHNNTRLLMDDCLRCHGMHHPGDISTVVAPVKKTGPWQLLEVGHDTPTMPCLACHAMHVDASNAKAGFLRGPADAGQPPNSGADSDSSEAGRRRQWKVRPSLALFDRRAQAHVPAQHLPIPAMHDGSRPLKTGVTPQTALCYQCHAPRASGLAGTNDDRTPRGVYEGMECLDCHDKHTLQPRQPCGDFHRDPSVCEDHVDASPLVNPPSTASTQ